MTTVTENNLKDANYGRIPRRQLERIYAHTQHHHSLLRRYTGDFGSSAAVDIDSQGPF